MQREANIDQCRVHCGDSFRVRRGPELVFNHEVCQIIARGRAGMSW
jgi:hypothetical protein